MIGFIVDTEFVWGFQARIVGLSKTSPSFYYPPPTTFLGALAEVLAKEYRLGESRSFELVSKLGRNLLAVGVRPLNCKPVKYEDINRIIMISRKTSKKLGKNILFPHPADLEASFDSPARGKTILASLTDDAPKLRWFIVFGENSFNLGEKTVEIDENAFWKIHRLGSKESVVSVTDVISFEPEVVSGVVETTYSFPSRKVEILKEEMPRNWVYEVYINPFRFENPVRDYIEGRNLLPFKVPIISVAGEEYFCRLNVEKAYRFGEEVVVGWSE